MEFEKQIVIGDRWVYEVDRNKNTWPRFAIEIRQRVRQKLAVNVLVTGEGGIGKSMLAIQLAQIIDADLDPEKQVVYTYSEYLDALMGLGKGKPIIFDEPSYALSHRSWFSEIQQALVKTMESQRFMLHPLFIPIINASLIDKTIRNFLIQYAVYEFARGKAVVYRLKPSQREDKTYYNTIARLDYPLLDSESCDKDSCLDCRDLETCQLLRGRYERKKARIQHQRYREGREEALAKETRTMTLDDIVAKAYSLRDHFKKEDGRIDVSKLRHILRTEAGIKIPLNKSYDVKTSLEAEHPTEFQ